MTPPLRFLLTVLGSWFVIRTGTAGWPELQAGAVLQPRAVAASAPGTVRVIAHEAVSGVADDPAVLYPLQTANHPWSSGVEGASVKPPPISREAAALNAVVAGPQLRLSRRGGSWTMERIEALPARTISQLPPAATLPRAARLKRWAVSSWTLWRPGEGAVASLAPGTLGGAQAGVRATWQVAPERLPRLALAARISSPLRRDGVEAALGLEWQPVRALPVRLVAERRQRITGEGRSAFAMFGHGGVADRPLAAGWSLDAYGAAGVVGARARDLFAEGDARITRVLGPVRVGAGAWGAAQPGAARLDVGPTLAIPLRLGPAHARVSLDYRVRVAGDAAPGSGPAVTVGADF